MAKHILTVEDSASLRQMVAFTLQEAGYDVTEAEDGRDAVNKIAGLAPDLVITDLNMPNMNGIELTRYLRGHSLFKYIPIVFLTTESQEKKKQAAREAGATGWIVKPFKPDQLLRVVHKVIG